MQIRNQSNIFQDKTLVDLNGPTKKPLTFAIIPKCDVLLTLHGVEAREPFELLVLWRELLESMSHVFFRPPSCINRKTWDEQMAQHWG
jgi:hypothetical protein